MRKNDGYETGAPLVFLHGNVGLGADWQPVMELLPGRFGCKAPELWDYFRSAPDACSYSNWVEWFCSRFAPDGTRPVLVGYSLGGRLALHAVAYAPGRFAGAVIISAHVGLRNEDEKAARLREDRAWGDLARADWGGFLRAWEAQPVFAGTTALKGRDRLVAWRDEIASAFGCWSLGCQRDLGAALEMVALPTLWITGECDRRFSAIAAGAAAAMPSGRHQIVAGAGHRVPWDQCAETARLIEQFVGSTGRETG